MKKVQKSKDHWIEAVDFDGTLAYQEKNYDPMYAGPPIKKTVSMVKKWLKQKKKVVIFTARVNTVTHTELELRRNRTLIQAWCKKYIGKVLPITAEKHPQFRYWDNNAHRIETNTGKILAQKYQLAHRPLLTEEDLDLLHEKYYKPVLEN